MSDVKRRRGGPSALGGMDDLQDSPTMGEVANDIFGSSSRTKSIRAKPISIMKIEPDTQQPRRAIPVEIRAQWGGDLTRIQQMFDVWLNRIAEERGSDLKWKDILSGDHSLRGTEAEDLRGDGNPLDVLDEIDLDEPDVSPLEASFMKLLDLAASIKRDGLTNPITVAPAGKDTYIIETGERRWLAYHLLKYQFGEEDWGDIPARQVQELDIWRQASENNARDDLNAVSKARQLALLLMTIHSEKDEVEFKNLSDFDHEQDFYAQVSDGNKWRVPRNYGEQLLNAMGLSSASHLRRYRAILRVDSSIWDAADDADWTERDIRDKWKQHQTRAKKRDQGHGNTETRPTPSNDEYLAERKLYGKTLNDIAKIAQIASVGEVSSTQRVEAEQKIKSLRDWLNKQEKLIRGK